MLTHALLQVLANYTMQCFSHSHVLIPIPMADLIPIPKETHGTHGIPGLPIPMHISNHTLAL